MGFTILKPQLPRRHPGTLYVSADPDVPSTYDQRWPGLYPDETAVQLDTGELVAVSVQRRRLPHGQGLEFRTWARWLEPDGKTQLDAHGQEVENEFPTNFDFGFIQSRARGDLDGEDVISRELMLAMLGEPPTMMEVLVDPDAAIEAPPEGHTADPQNAQIELVHLDEAVRNNIGIRQAIRMATTPIEGKAASLLAG